MIFEYLELLSFERPLFLVFAFQPLIFMFFRRVKMHSLSRYSEKKLWPWSINISEQHFKSRTILMFIAWLLIAIAMSGPRLPSFNKSYSIHDKKIKNDISIMLIADVNGINESEFNSYLIRLSDFIDNLQGEKIGFVALGTSSALISPLTSDYSISYFYLKQMFDVINLNPNSNVNNLFKSLKVSYAALKNSKASTSAIIYWSDYTRNKLTNNQLIKTRILLEEMQGENIKTIPIWNNSSEIGRSSRDIYSIFGESAHDYTELTLQELYHDQLESLKSLTLFDSSKKHGYQQLYAYLLIPGLFLLLISIMPFQIFNQVKK